MQRVGDERAKRQSRVARGVAWIREIVEPGDLASKTKQGYERTVRRHLVPGLGRIKLAKLTPMHVQRFINDELESGKRRRTVQLSHAVLRIALGQP